MVFPTKTIQQRFDEKDERIEELEVEVGRLRDRMKVALLHLDGSVCECGFHLKETDAADTLRDALEAGGEDVA